MILNKLKHMRIKRSVRRKFKKRLGYTLDLEAPKTYCEKIQWLKFNQIVDDQRIVTRADKYAVRAYVESKGFGEHLVDLYGSWHKPEKVDWQKLPNRFVLKLTNGSGSRYCWFVKDKKLFSRRQFENDARTVRAKKYGLRYGEFHYAKMPSRVIAEEYLEGGAHGIKDYKFYCFHGKVAFFSVEQGKVEGDPVRDYYDIDWSRSSVRFFGDHPRPEQPFTKPANFDRMILMAETLSFGYPHIRVDLYNVDSRVFFGELTYTPENGLTRRDPPSLDLKYGRLMDVNNNRH